LILVLFYVYISFMWYVVVIFPGFWASRLKNKILFENITVRSRVYKLCTNYTFPQNVSYADVTVGAKIRELIKKNKKYTFTATICNEIHNIIFELTWESNRMLSNREREEQYS